MKEIQLHELIISNPSLIEDGLTFLGREVPIGNYRCDLLFEDKNKRKLYVEVKLKATDKVAGQIMRYRSLASPHHARYMVVALTFVHGIKEGLVLHGYEYKEINISEQVNKFITQVQLSSGINLIDKAKLSKAEAKYKTPDELITHLGSKSSGNANIARLIFEYACSLSESYYYMSDGIMFVRQGSNNKFLSISSVQERLLFHFPVAERNHIFEENKHSCAIYLPKDTRDKNQIDIKLKNINNLDEVNSLIDLAYEKRK